MSAATLHAPNAVEQELPPTSTGVTTGKELGERDNGVCRSTPETRISVSGYPSWEVQKSL